jgi:hypothetical protein
VKLQTAGFSFFETTTILPIHSFDHAEQETSRSQKGYAFGKHAYQRKARKQATGRKKFIGSAMTDRSRRDGN